MSPATAASPWPTSPRRSSRWAIPMSPPTSRPGTSCSARPAGARPRWPRPLRANSQHDFGHAPAVLLRTVPDLARVVATSPFPKKGADPSRHHVTFLATAPEQGATGRLHRAAERARRADHRRPGGLRAHAGRLRRHQAHRHPPGTPARRREHDPELEHGHQAARARRGLTPRRWRWWPSTGRARAPGPPRTSGWPTSSTGSSSPCATAAPVGRWSTTWSPGAPAPRAAWWSGLDFSFSFPAWFLRAQSCATVGELWETVEQKGEGWLAECASPFWGRPGRPATRAAGVPPARRGVHRGRGHQPEEHVPNRGRRRRRDRIHPGHAPPPPAPGGRVLHLALRSALALARSSRSTPASAPGRSARAAARSGRATSPRRSGRSRPRSRPPWSDPRTPSTPPSRPW